VFNASRESNVEILRGACFAYEKAVVQLTAKVRELTQKLADLEGIEAAQIGLDLPEIHLTVGGQPPAAQAPPADPRPARPRAPQTGHGPTPQPNLPIQPLHHVFTTSPPCAVCGGPMAEMKGQFEESEEISVVSTSFQVFLHQRQKYRCRCNAQVLTAPGPPKLIPGGRYSVDFAIHSAIGKFCDHLPLERQVRQAARQGLEISSQTLWDQHAALAAHLKPTWERLCTEVLREPVLHVDETGWRMWGRGSANPKWSLFGLTSPRFAAYHLVGSKDSKTARRLLKGFKGTLVVDGFAIYPIVAELEKDIRIAHCWAHADRKFKEAKDPPQAISTLRGWIAELYQIEREVEVEGCFPGDETAQALRHALRQEKSAPIVKEIRAFALSQGGLRRSDFGKALRYMLQHWDGLTLFLKDPKIPLDNNAAERVLRGPVVGRKNFYGNRSRHGAEVAAILYSLIETAKLNGLEPSAYLRHAALAAIDRPGAVLLPVVKPDPAAPT
jgi:transposase